MSGKEEFFNLIRQGREGNNIGLSIGSPKLELYMDGFLPGTSYLFGGVSGTGKIQIFCRLYKELYRELSGNIGESCDANTEISIDSNESIPL